MKKYDSATIELEADNRATAISRKYPGEHLSEFNPVWFGRY